MKIYKLYGRTDSGFMFGWDMHFGFVIRAENEQQARKLAYEKSNRSAWLDPELTSCDEVMAEGQAEIILEDYNAG